MLFTELPKTLLHIFKKKIHYYQVIIKGFTDPKGNILRMNGLRLHDDQPVVTVEETAVHGDNHPKTRVLASILKIPVKNINSKVLLVQI